MSDRPGWPVVAVALAIAALPGTVPGQSVDSLRRLVDSLDRRHRVLVEERSRRERARLEGGLTDTVRVGGLTILVTRRDRGPVEQLADSLWPLLQTRFGPAASLAANCVFLVHRDSAGSGRTRRLAMTRFVRRPSGEGKVCPPGAIAAGGAALEWGGGPLEELVSSSIWRQSDPGLLAWGGSDFTILPPASELERVYLQLVTAPSAANRDCLAGIPSRCGDALGLLPDSERLGRWYDDGDLPSAIRRVWGFRNPPVVASCLEGIVSACHDALDQLPPSQVPWPLDPLARTSLLRLVLEAGGADAYPKLLARPGEPIAVRLATAAGVSTDSLLLLWRSKVIAARPKSVRVEGPTAGAALLWFGLLAVAGLGSSRWR